MVKKFSLAELAEFCGAHIVGDEKLMISGVAPVDGAGEDDIALAMNARYLEMAESSRAAAFIVGEGVELEGANLLVSKNPYWAFARILSRLYPEVEPSDNIHPTSIIGDDFSCKGKLSTEPYVVIGKRVKIGSACHIGAGSVIGDDCVIGDNCLIHPNVSLYPKTILGDRVIIHSGSVIGSDGFGFAPNDGKWEKIPHLGRVKIGSDVEIGSGCTIDRGTFGLTHIASGVKMDGQVHIGHNVFIDEDSLLVAKVGIAGSASIGKNTIIAARAGIGGHIRIGNNVKVGPMAGVGRDVPDGEVVIGAPEMPYKLWLRVQNLITKLPEMRKRIIALERALKAYKE